MIAPDIRAAAPPGRTAATSANSQPPPSRRPSSTCIVNDDLTSRRARRNADRTRFGPPSDYSLSVAELAAHMRQLQRRGWLRWEIRTRFGRRWAA
jgi:hypothetical protein